MGLINVNLRQIPPALTLTPVPDGWYKVRIVKSNIKTTAKGDGGYLELQHEVLEGAHQGRIIYWNLNLFNPSNTASEIAYKQLSAIGHCLGVYDLQDQNTPDAIVPQLHGQPYFIWVVVGQGNQGPINNVRGCKDINGNDPGKGAGGGAAPMPMQQPQWGGAQPQPSFAPGGGGTAPAGWTPQPANPAPTATPQGPGGGAWQPGTNTQPQPAWQPNQPTGQPYQPPAAQPPQQQQPPAQQWTPPPAQQQQPPGNWGGGQPTQQQPQQQPPNQGWQQGGAPSNAPWQR